jgi:hypothetical protein
MPHVTQFRPFFPGVFPGLFFVAPGTPDASPHRSASKRCAVRMKAVITGLLQDEETCTHLSAHDIAGVVLRASRQGCCCCCCCPRHRRAPQLLSRQCHFQAQKRGFIFKLERVVGARTFLIGLGSFDRDQS